MRVDVVTIFPAYLEPLRLSLIGRAREQGLIDLRVHDLREFTHDRHRSVDDTPYGGGAGMVMRPEPWGEALDAVCASGPVGTATAPLLVLPSPAGEPLTQPTARRLAQEPWVVVACGRYEGIDERVMLEARRSMTVLELSLGDFVVNGGEVAALVLVEAVARLLPGVLGNADSVVEESHEQGLLEHPVYTKPPSWRGHDVPEVLLSGHHERVRRWRRDQSLRRTSRVRPDLVAALDPRSLDEQDFAVLAGQDTVAPDEPAADASPFDPAERARSSRTATSEARSFPRDTGPVAD